MMRIARGFAFVCMTLLGACRDTTGPIDPDLAVITPGDTLFSSLVSSGWTSCALTVGGRAFCWGSNSSRMLGPQPTGCPGEPSSIYCENRPIPVGAGLRFSRLALSSSATCGITPSQRLYCWGDTPKPWGGSLRFTDVSARNNLVCALATDGQTYCWGDSYSGRLGIPTGSPPQTLDAPRPVVGEHHFSTIQVTDGPVCGTTTSGLLYCWGGLADTTRFDGAGVVFNQCWRSVNLPLAPCSNVPLRWRGSEQWARYVSGGTTCGITTGGGARCWGSTVYFWGRLPFGRSESPSVLAEAPEGLSLLLPTPIRDILAPGYDTGGCAHAVDGRVLCWGADNRGVFGTGSQNGAFPIPTVVAGGRAFTQLSAGIGYMCGLAAAGDIWCWGNDMSAALGTGEVTPEVAQGFRVLATPTRIASIAGR